MRRLLAGYGMLGVLVLLCAYFAWATLHSEYPEGASGGARAARAALSAGPLTGPVTVVASPDADGRAFAAAASDALRRGGAPAVEVTLGDPAAARAAVERLAAAGMPPALVLTTRAAAEWTVWDRLREAAPALRGLTVQAPRPSTRSTFLSTANLRNVADQIAVIAIVAVGMTMVIITGGIDLSVGSIVALSAVVAAWLIREAGGAGASGPAMAGAALAACAMGGAVGLFSGVTIARFHVPPFIATLAVMQIASGLAFIVARGQSIYDLPRSFTWLGRGAGLAAIPNAVLLMAAVYVAAHVLMTRTALGRRIYAVGGNREAARLSGVSTGRTLLFVYAASGMMAGLGGVVTASQLKAGAPTYGLMYELYVIAAVVVGGTSLSGGEGRILGTLIGAFIIAVIRNGMNLTDVEPYTQKVVLGVVILLAVLLDMLKHRRWRRARAGAAT